MNRIFILVALCWTVIFFCNEAWGEDIYTHTPDEEGEPTRSWRVFGAMTNHPDDSPMFVVDDIFLFQKDAGNSRNVKFKPVNMKNPGWRENGHPRTIVFTRYPSAEDTRYLCAVAVFQGVHHLIAISPMAEHKKQQIVIQYDHAMSANPEQCENVTLPSHGGLAHAHAVR